MALLLVAGVAVSTWQAVRATRAEQAATAAGLAEAERAEGERMAKVDALAQKTAAEQAAAQETAANAQAQKRLAQIEKANDILGSIFENLDPKEVAKAERPLQTILVEKLDQAEAQLEGESIGDPLLVAAMQGKLGKSLLGLGEAAKAIVLLEKARDTFQAEFGPEHPDTLSGMGNLALAYLTAGSWTWLCRSSRKHSRSVKVNSAPNIPTPSSSWATSPRRIRMPGSWTWPCRSSRRRSHSRNPNSAPNIPTRSLP
jgi:non-specific serine/threonine protein kinase/serine/threonine-protein kinase